MKFFYKEAVLFLGLFAISAGSTYYYCYSSGSSNKDKHQLEETPATPAQQLVASMTELKKFGIDANLEFVYQKDMTHGELNVAGTADITDLANPKVKGSLEAMYGGTSFAGALTYIDNNVYVDYNDSHLKLANSDISGFVDVLPSLGLNIALPEEITNLDLGALLSDLENMEPTADSTGFYFQYNLMEGVDIFFKTDENYHFTGLETSRFFFKDMRLFLHASINEKDYEDLVLENPETALNAPKYISFRPALNMFEGLHNVFTRDQNTLGLNLDIKKTDTTTQVTSDFIGVQGDVSYDLSNSATIGIDLDVHENKRVHEFEVYLMDKVLFLNQANINKVSIEGQNIFAVLDYVITQIKDEQLKALMDKFATLTQGIDINSILSNLENLNAWIKDIQTLDNKIVVTFDLSVFNIGINEITLEVSLNQKELLGIKLANIVVNNLTINLELTVKTYNMVPPVASEYVKLDPALDLVPVIFDLIAQKQFRFKLNGGVDMATSNNDVNIDAAFQMDLTNRQGYGQATIVDCDTYKHNIKADFGSKSGQDNLLLVSYNDKLNAKMTEGSLNDLILLVKEIANNPSEHFFEIFGDLLNSLKTTPLGQALNGDIGILFATETFTNINVTNDVIEMDISGAIINLDTKFHLAIRYNADRLIGISVSNLNMNGNIIHLDIDLDTYQPDLEATRLKENKSFLDFSSIKMLLEMGINTSKFNDFHFNGVVTVTAKILGIPINLDIPVRADVHNEKGSVSVQAMIDSVPIVPAVTTAEGYKNTYSRKTSVYYENQTVYINRVDKVKEKLIFGPELWLNVSGVIDETEFMNNILNYLLGDAIGLRSNLLNEIHSSTQNKDPNAPKEQIIYETLLNDYAYNTANKYFYIDLNIAELAKNPDLTALTIKLNADEQARLLTGLEAFLNVSVGVQISVHAKLDSINPGTPGDFTVMNKFIQDHSADVRNTINKSTTPVA